MNSGAQAQAHLTGTKHRHRMDKVEQEMMDKVGVGRSLLDKVGWGRCLVKLNGNVVLIDAKMQ